MDYISSPQSNQVYHLNGAPTVGVTANSEHDHALDGFTPNTNTTVYTFGSLTMPGAVVQYARTENVTFDAMGHWEKTNPLSNARNLGAGNYEASAHTDTDWGSGAVQASSPAHSHPFSVVC